MSDIMSWKIALALFCTIIAFVGYKASRMNSDLRLSLCKLKSKYFQRKLIWITGASSGIGETLAHQLAADGARLVLSARNVAKLRRIKSTLMTNHKLQDKDIMVLPLDLSKHQTHRFIHETLYAQILRHFNVSSIDVLINNAGIAHDSLTDEVPFDDIYGIYNVNLIAPAILTRTVLSDMVRNNTEFGGHIVNISSCTSYFENGAMSIYVSSKQGLNGLSRVLQTEMAFIAPKVKCTLCVLGAINTGIHQRMTSADGKVGSETWQKWGRLEQGMSAQQCAQLICTAVCNGLDEAWISKQPELLYMYLTQQFPNLHARFRNFWMKIGFPPFLDHVNRRRTERSTS